MFSTLPARRADLQVGTSRAKAPAYTQPLSNPNLGLFHLIEVQFHRGGTSENSDHHAQRGPIVVDFIYQARKVLEGAFIDLDGFALVKPQAGLGVLRRHFDFVYDAVNLLRSEGAGHLTGPHKPSNTGGRAHQMPTVVVHLHFNQHVSRIEELGRYHLSALAHLDDVLARNHDLPELIREPGCLDPAAQGLRHLLLEPRIGMDDVPVFGHA